MGGLDRLGSLNEARPITATGRCGLPALALLGRRFLRQEGNLTMGYSITSCLPACLPACLIVAAWVAEPAQAQFQPPFETEPVLIQWVNPDNPGPNFTGDSMANGFPSIEYAFNPSTNSELNGADLRIEIRLLGSKVYIPNGTLTVPPSTNDPRDATFALPRAVLRVSGGWTGNELPGAPPAGRPSILSGDRGVPGVPTDNCYHVVVTYMSTYNNVEANSQWLDNLIIEGGYANGAIQATVDRGSGGGILNRGGHVRLTEVTIRDCYANCGGGIASVSAVAFGGDPFLPSLWARGSTIRDCVAETAGGGLYTDRCTRVVLTNVVCRNNFAGVDGGGYWAGALIPNHAVVNSVFHDNVAYGRGGAIFVADQGSGSARMRIVNCTIAYNTGGSDEAGPGGSGLYMVADRGSATGLSRASLVNTIVYANPGYPGAVPDNIQLGAPTIPGGPAVHTVDVTNCFIGGRITNPNTSLVAGIAGLPNGTPYGQAFIDAGLTGELPGWVNPAARNFRLQVTSRCVDQGTDVVFELLNEGSDFMDLDGDRLYRFQTVPNGGGFTREALSREHFRGDNVWLNGSMSTREVNVPGAGQSVPPNIGLDGGQVLGQITDIGAFEYRIYAAGV